jgi:hypothetical protein
VNKGTDGDGIHNDTRRTDQKQITEKRLTVCFQGGEPKATGQIEWTGAIVSFVCVDRLATDGLYAIRHGCYILVGPRYLLSDEFSQVGLGSIERRGCREGGGRGRK